jgi:GntR family transcriptional regulator, transcriptional repressor for pyruvate dehydrogenase complex
MSADGRQPNVPDSVPRTPSSALRLSKIDPARAHEEVVEQIVYAIRSGGLRLGARLPTIDDLAESTGVSRPVVGEAVRMLRDHGIVATKRGVKGGVIVITEDIPIDLLPSRGWRHSDLTDLVEARRPIETTLSILAAERADADDLADMRESLRSLEIAVMSPDGSFLRYDHRFHYQIGRAAKSETLAFYQHQILCAIAVMLDQYGLYHEDRDLVVQTHTDMYSAIEAGDMDLIRAANDRHWSTSGGAFASIDFAVEGEEAGV